MLTELNVLLQPPSQLVCDISVWDTPAARSEMALQGGYVCLSEQVIGTVRMLLSAPQLRQVPKSPSGIPHSRAEQSALVPWLLGLHCYHKLNYNWFGHGQSSLQTPFLTQWGCPFVGNGPGTGSFLHVPRWVCDNK